MFSAYGELAEVLNLRSKNMPPKQVIIKEEVETINLKNVSETKIYAGFHPYNDVFCVVAGIECDSEEYFLRSLDGNSSYKRRDVTSSYGYPTEIKTFEGVIMFWIKRGMTFYEFDSFLELCEWYVKEKKGTSV